MFVCLSGLVFYVDCSCLDGTTRSDRVGNFASQDFVSFHRMSSGSFAENRGDLRRPTTIAEIRGDDESAQKLRRRRSKSRLAKLEIRPGISNALKGNGIGATGSENQSRFLEPGAKGS